MCCVNLEVAEDEEVNSWGMDLGMVGSVPKNCGVDGCVNPNFQCERKGWFRKNGKKQKQFPSEWGVCLGGFHLLRSLG